MHFKHEFFLIPLLALAMVTPAVADVKLPAIIDSHMVLQCGTHASIWGWADAGEVVSVSFAGQVKQTIAAANGKWRVTLDPLAVSSESRTMTITGNNVIELEDVLVGEVWLASGQSNMEFSIGAIPAEEKTIAAAQVDNKLLRMFCVAPKVSSSLPLKDVAGYWSDCSYFIQQMRARKIKIFDSHSAVAFFFGLKLQQALQVPVAVIDSSWGGTKIESWIADDGYEMEGLALRKMTAQDEAQAVVAQEALELAVAAWNEDARAAVENGEYPKPNLEVPRSRVPNAIYNGMIAPVVPFSIKGVVWYQGESNRASQDYFEKLKALMGGWSQVFNVPNLPFYLVQMAPYNYAHDKAKHLSEQIIYDNVVSAQYKAAQEIKGCDVINISDTVFGNVKNVHPPHKKTVGDRLAAMALKNDYGKDVVCSGPRFLDAILVGNQVQVSFEYVDQGLETTDGEAPNWFEIAGEDQIFVVAEAKIDGEHVLVSSPEVNAPRYIRMAWNNIAEQNLRDKNGWPVFSFSEVVGR